MRREQTGPQIVEAPLAAPSHLGRLCRALRGGDGREWPARRRPGGARGCAAGPCAVARTLA
eukprot:scaffold2090_cov225-Prasinococcus_capsulatus_cf.AAC.54